MEGVGQCSGRSAAVTSISRSVFSVCSAMCGSCVDDRHSGRHWRQPVAVSLGLAHHAIEECRLKLRRYGTAPAFADYPSIDLADGRHFGGSSGKECLIGDVEVIARDAARGYRVTHFPGESDYRLTGDADERAGKFGFADLAVLDDEQIFSGTFRDETVDVEQQRLVVAVLGRLQVRQYGVGVGARVFRAAHRYIDVMPRERGCFYAYAFFKRFGPEICAPRPRSDRDMHPCPDRRDAHLLGTVKRDRT